jgi:hypothetical protein
MRDVDPECDLDPLQGIHRQDAQLLVEDIEPDRLLEGCPRLEIVECDRFDALSIPRLSAWSVERTSGPERSLNEYQ